MENPSLPRTATIFGRFVKGPTSSKRKVAGAARIQNLRSSSHGPRGLANDADRIAHFKFLEKQLCRGFRQSNTTVRRGVAGQDARMQSAVTIKAKEISHRCRHETTAARQRIEPRSVAAQQSSTGTQNSSVERRKVVQLF